MARFRVRVRAVVRVMARFMSRVNVRVGSKIFVYDRSRFRLGPVLWLRLGLL